MKKQGEFYLKLISILLAVLLAVFVLCSIFLRSGQDYTLESAVYCEVGDGLTVSGFVVRSEEILVSSSPWRVPERAEGEHVGSGQIVATGYASEEATAARRALNDLQQQRDQLKFALEGAKDNADEQIAQQIIRLSSQTARQDLPGMRAAAEALAPYVLQRSLTSADTPRMQARLSNLDEQIALLEAECASEATPITVSKAGCYSCITDGYEDILTPAFLETMTVSDLHEAESRRTEVPERAIGRLIFGQTWYFVTELPAQEAQRCEVGSKVHLKEDTLQDITMRVERVGEAEDGACLLVLSCDRKINEVTDLRALTAELVFRTYSGLRIPKCAVYYEDDEAGVYVLETPKARWKPIEILYEYGEYCLVRCESGSVLRENDPVILTDEEIRDGSVMTE